MRPYIPRRPLDDLAPAEKTENGRGLLLPNTSRLTADDADLIGTMRVGGRLIKLLGWVVTTNDGRQLIRLAVKE